MFNIYIVVPSLVTSPASSSCTEVTVVVVEDLRLPHRPNVDEGCRLRQREGRIDAKHAPSIRGVRRVIPPLSPCYLLRFKRERTCHTRRIFFRTPGSPSRTENVDQFSVCPTADKKRQSVVCSLSCCTERPLGLNSMCAAWCFMRSSIIGIERRECERSSG